MNELNIKDEWQHIFETRLGILGVVNCEPISAKWAKEALTNAKEDGL